MSRQAFKACFSRTSEKRCRFNAARTSAPGFQFTLLRPSYPFRVSFELKAA